MVISGNTRLIAHLGYPTAKFKAPMIYNPWLVHQQVDAKVVPMGVKPEDYAAFVPMLFKMTNIIGALVTMPHKIATCGLVQHLSPTAAIAGACNAIRPEADGTLSGDMFDGEGFVLGITRKGFQTRGARALVVGSGGVGSAIAASLAAAGVSALTLYDICSQTAEALAGRLLEHYPRLDITLMQRDHPHSRSVTQSHLFSDSAPRYAANALNRVINHAVSSSEPTTISIIAQRWLNALRRRRETAIVTTR